jgi:hypothetical protein
LNGGEFLAESGGQAVGLQFWGSALIKVIEDEECGPEV